MPKTWNWQRVGERLELRNFLAFPKLHGAGIYGFSAACVRRKGSDFHIGDIVNSILALSFLS